MLAAPNLGNISDIASRKRMTGANATGLISEIIAVLKDTTKDYNILNDDKGLREAFHEAGRGLLLVEEALQSARIQIDPCSLAGDHQRAMILLDDCNTKAKVSKSIFKDVAQAVETSRFERYKTAVRQEGKGNTVEVLVKGMMNDISDLAKDSAIEIVMDDQVTGLREAIDKLSTMEPSIPNQGSGDTFSNFGSGNQFNAPGGTQNNNTGSGNQFPGAVFSGSVTFGKRTASP